MMDWIPMDQWVECAKMERAGIVFEVRNATGQILRTACVPGVPEVPFDWTAPPIEFRPVPELPPKHSAPLPNPS
jgi:hypothetical protein